MLTPQPKRASVPSPTTKVDLASVLATLLRAAADPTLVGLGAAAPSAELLPGRKLARLIGPILRRNAGHDAYSTAPGLLELRREIARRAVDWGALLSPDDIVTTCGGTEALYLALRAVTSPGDTVIVESPAYFGVLLLLQNLGPQGRRGAHAAGERPQHRGAAHGPRRATACRPAWPPSTATTRSAS